MQGQKPREIAARILQRRSLRGIYTESLLDEELSGSGLAPKDRALVQQLVYGVARWERTLDWLIARKTDNRVQKGGVQILLRLGLFQIFWLERIPNHAAVNETVALAKGFGLEGKSGFVNAVLRGYLREEAVTRALLEQTRSTEMALGHSHPDWLVERWLKRSGPEATRQLLEWNNQPAPTYARINSLKTTLEQLALIWKEEGVEFEPVQRDWLGPVEMVLLTRHPALDNLLSFQKGLFYIQDPSTVLAVAELGAQPGEEVLDLCAAPGGKTTLIAQLMQNRGAVLAYDQDPARLNLVNENAARLGTKSVQYAGAPSDFASRTFDRTLLDAPCSNTGVLRRRVDLRWRVKPEEITRLRNTQRDLLKKAAGTVRPGGTLVYSTCSLEEEENEQLVREFLETERDFRLVSERQLHPSTDQCDGAYVAKLERLR